MASWFEHAFSSDDENDLADQRPTCRRITMQLRAVTSYEVNYVNIGGYGPMPFGWVEDTSSFEQLHETQGELSRRGVFTGVTRMVS